MKKAFTLIELLSVVVIIGVISLITVPIVFNTIENSKEKAYEEQIKQIEAAASKYGSINELGYSSKLKIISLETLKDAGLLESKYVVNPKTDENLSGCVSYRWLEEYKQYEYKYTNDCEVKEDL